METNFLVSSSSRCILGGSPPAVRYFEGGGTHQRPKMSLPFVHQPYPLLIDCVKSVLTIVLYIRSFCFVVTSHDRRYSPEPKAISLISALQLATPGPFEDAERVRAARLTTPARPREGAKRVRVPEVGASVSLQGLCGRGTGGPCSRKSG